MFNNNISKRNSQETPADLLESLYEKTLQYGKTTLQLAKLKALHKTSKLVSDYMLLLVVGLFIFIFMLFLNLGLAIWLGEILGKSYYGFLLVALFYGLVGMFIHLFLQKWIKRITSDHFINQTLK